MFPWITDTGKSRPDRAPRPDMEVVENQLRRARLRLRMALSPENAIEAVKEAESIQKSYRSSATWARIAIDQFPHDPTREEDAAFYNQADPLFEHHLNQYYNALIHSRFRSELEKHYGLRLFVLADHFQQMHHPETQQERTREQDLMLTYRKRVARQTVLWNGKSMSPSQMEPLLQNPDRMVRRQAGWALAQSYDQQAKENNRLFAKLLESRKALADQLGLPRFTDLAYQRLGRREAVRDEVATLREAVKRYIIPLAREIRRLQRKRLKLEHLAWYDCPCFFPEGNPPVLMSGDQFILSASTSVDDLAGEKTDYLLHLADRGYMDLEARTQKYPGDYCALIESTGIPFLFMNASGTARDVGRFFCLAGQAWGMLRGQNPSFAMTNTCVDPGLRALHGQAMVCLTWPRWEPFFGTLHDEAVLMNLAELILRMPAACQLDEFQHRVYDTDEMTLSECDALWRSLTEEYQPDLDYEATPFFSEGKGWQINSDLFLSPFTAIDEVTSSLTALDLWQDAFRHPRECWERYDHLCSMDGASASDLIQQANLASPFAPETIKRVAYAVCDALAL